MEIEIEEDVTLNHFEHLSQVEKERHLHGHNWKFNIKVNGKLGDNGKIVDETKLRTIVTFLDYTTVLPQCKNVKVDKEDEDKNTVKIKDLMNKREYVLPKEDVVVLESVDQVTPENLLNWVRERVKNEIGDKTIVVEVSDGNRIARG